MPPVHSVRKYHWQNRCLCIDSQAESSIVKIFKRGACFIKCTFRKDNDITFMLQRAPHKAHAEGTALGIFTIYHQHYLFIYKAQYGYSGYLFFAKCAKIA